MEAPRCTECNEPFDSNWSGSFREVCQNCTSAGTVAQTSGALVIHEDNGIGESVNHPSSLEGRATWDGTQWVPEQVAPRVGQIANWDGTQWVIADQAGPTRGWPQANPGTASIGLSQPAVPQIPRDLSTTVPNPNSRRRRSGWILGGALGVVVLVVAVIMMQGGVTPWKQSQDFLGSFTLIDSGKGILPWGIARCNGAGGYADIRQGTQVTVKNDSGKYLASATLGDGDFTTGQCVFRFRVTLTEGEKAYAVSVSHRGDIFYTWDDLTSRGIQLSLGN